MAAAILAFSPRIAPAAEVPVTAVACDAPGAPSAPHVIVRVSGARDASGNMTVTLYGPDPARFLASRGKIARLRVPVRDGGAEACFAVSAPGEFAVAVYHDENDDHDFNRSLVGLPAEGYGFSNNPRNLLGVPSFQSVRVQVGAAGGVIPVTLEY